jgi:hypothetical protein
MSVRTDVTVDWSTSPRLLTVAAPSVEITIQDLVDTCRYFENLPQGMLHPKLIDAAGKEFLGGITYVGVTATLQNAVLAFEARGGPSWVLCTISGGNLVALDDVGAVIDPRYPTAFTTVDRTASASATLQEQEALQYSSYGAGVSLDVTSGNSGTDYPVGNQEYPVDNLADAIAIANDKGFKTIFIEESMTLASETVSNLKFIGRSHVLTEVTIDPSLVCDGVTFENCNVAGTLDGGTHIDHSTVGSITYVNGHIHDCGLYGTITLAGSEDAVLDNCIQLGTASPIVDMGGSGQNLSVTKYDGQLTITNFSGVANVAAIGVSSGHVILDATVTAGGIIVAGTGVLTNNATSVTFLNTDGLMSRQTITEIVWDTVYVDTANGSSGTAFPLGTAGNPVDNIADAKTIADAHSGINRFFVHGDITLSGDWSSYDFEADSPAAGSVTLSSVTATHTLFKHLTIDGSISSGHVHCTDCIFDSGLTGLAGEFENCQFFGTFTVIAGTSVKGDRCTSSTGATFDCNGTGSVQLANFSGIATYTNCTNAASVMAMAGNFVLTFDSSITAGQSLVAGIGVFTDNSTSLTSLTQRVLPVATWESLVTGQSHPNGSAGQVLENVPLLIAQSEDL